MQNNKCLITDQTHVRDEICDVFVDQILTHINVGNFGGFYNNITISLNNCVFVTRLLVVPPNQHNLLFVDL